MPTSDVVVQLSRVLTLLGIAVLVVRLYRFELHRKYRVFFWYLIFWTCRSGVLLTLDVRSGAYMMVWVVTEPGLWLFYILLVLELYSLILESHKGLYTMGRWALYGALTISVFLSLLSLIPASEGGTRQSNILSYMYLIERGIDLSVVLFLLIILVFLARFPVSLSRNVIVHSVLYSAFFLSNTLGFLAASTLGFHFVRSVNLFLMGVSTVCVFVWLALITRGGESRAATLLRPWRAEHEAHLVDQLSTLNATLLRAARK